jgi:hypothetical protein
MLIQQRVKAPASLKKQYFLSRGNAMNTTTTDPPIVPVSPWIWPGILIAGPASVIVACIITAFFVVKHPDGLVASDYYKQGKAINAQLAQIKRAELLGLHTMKMAATDTMLAITFPDAQLRDRIEVILAHPVDADLDIRAFLSPNAAGTYEIALKNKLAERRRVIVTDSPARSWRVEALLIPALP